MKTGKCIAFLIIAVLIVPAACDNHNVLDDNFHDTGFISDDRFQVVVKIAPAENARGLVQKRESAMKEGKSLLVDHVVSEMWAYCQKYREAQGDKNVPTYSDEEKKFRESVKKYAKKGSSSLEYFDEDDAVTIVYRIDRKNLKQKIQSIAEEISGKKNARRGADK